MVENRSCSLNHTIRLQIGLKQGNFSELERILYEDRSSPSPATAVQVCQPAQPTLSTVSDPSNPNYGQWPSREEVEELVKPTDETSIHVKSWLKAHEVDDKAKYSRAKDSIAVTLPVHAVERLLDTEYSVFEHADGTRLVRAPEWSLPLHLHDRIEMVQPTNAFITPRAKKPMGRLKCPSTVELPEELVQARAMPPTL